MAFKSYSTIAFIWIQLVLIFGEKESSIGHVDYPSSSPLSNTNITILHEVFDGKPLELNKHEVLPVKPSKKKPTSILQKPKEFEKVRPLKEYEAHPVTFDFNLGDLEDIDHETIRKGDLSSEERHLLTNADAEGITFSETFSGTTNYPENITSMPKTLKKISQLESNHYSAASPHIFKVIKNKSKVKGRGLLKKEELQKTFGNHYNSISRLLGDSPNNSTSASLQADNANIFQIIVNLYDHFYWQPSDIRTRVSAVCGVELHAYLTALNNNYEWAQKGEREK